ncbi:hypothetical protein Dimus_013510 [Dionaea muscipula]
MVKGLDGEFRDKLGCRRSGRLSSPVIPVESEMGTGRVPILKPIVEDLKAEVRQDIDDGDLEVQVKSPEEFGGCSEGPSDEDSDVAGDLMRAPSVMCEGSGDPCLVPLTVLPLPEEAKESGGAAIPLVVAGQIIGDLPESTSQVISSLSSVMPLEEPNLSSCCLPAVSLEETGEVLVCSLQGISVAVSDGMKAESSGEQHRVQSMVMGDDQILHSHAGHPKLAGEELGSFKAEAVAAHLQAERFGIAKVDSVPGDCDTPLADGDSKGKGDRGGADLLPSHRWPSSARLAPAPCQRRRDDFASGWEAWLEAYPDALKKATERVRVRRLVKKLTMVKGVDGDFREKLGCRRSGRLSPPVLSVVSEMGTGSVPILKPIVEELEAEVLQDIIDGDMEVQANAPEEFGGCSEGHSDEDSDAAGELTRDSAVMCEGSGDPCLVPLTLLPLPEEAKELDGDAIPLVVAGQTIGDAPESTFQVISYPSSLLPSEEPKLSSGCLPAVRLEEKGEVLVCSLQGLPVDDPAGMRAEYSGEQHTVQSMVMGDDQVLQSHEGHPKLAGEGMGSVMAEAVVAHTQAEGIGFTRADSVPGDLESHLAVAVPGVQVRRSGGGSPGVGTASRFAPLSEVDEDSVEEDCGVRGVLDREGHRLASSCVDALFDACEVIGDGPETAGGGKVKGRGRGGRRGGSTRGRGGRSRGRGPS